MEKIDKDTREYVRAQLVSIENELSKSESVGYIDNNYIAEKVNKINRELKLIKNSKKERKLK